MRKIDMQIACATVLDEVKLTAMRARAAANASPFVDPVTFRKAQTVLAGADGAWLSRVIGHEVRSWTYLAPAEMALAVQAAEVDAEHLQALRDQRYAGYRAAEQDRAERVATANKARREAWEILCARLPVPVNVRHNWTARHLEGYEQGADHIVVEADLDAGRLHRTVKQPLCWTPSRARELRYVDGSADDEKRIPNLQGMPAARREAR